MGTKECSATLQKGRIIKAHKNKSDVTGICVAVISQAIQKKKENNPTKSEHRLECTAAGDLKW